MPAMTKRLCLLLLLGGWPGLSWARLLDLRSCLRMAESHSTVLPSAAADRDIAGLSLQSSLSPFYPQLSLSASQIGYGYSTAGKLIESPYRWDTDTYSGAFTANLNLFNSFRDTKAVQRGRTGIESADQATRERLADLRLGVVQSYFSLLKQRRLTEVHLSFLGQRREILKQAEALYRDGSRSYTELLAARSQVRSQELALSEIRFETLQQNLRFASLLGLETGEEVEPADIRGDLQPAPAVERSLALAQASRPDLLRMKAALRESDLAVQSAVLNDLPALRVDGFYTKNLAQYGQPQALWTNRDHLEENGTWNLGASLTYQFFQGFAGMAQTGMARDSREKIRLALEEAGRNAEMEVRLACLRLQQDLTAFELNDALNAASHQNLAEVRKRYRQGVSSLLEVTGAATDALQADTSRLTAFYDYQVDLAKWKKAVGSKIGDE